MIKSELTTTACINQNFYLLFWQENTTKFLLKVMPSLQIFLFRLR